MPPKSANAQEEVKRYKQQQAWFEGRVRRYEQIAEANPAAYRMRVRLFGWLGYGYILFILLVLVAVVAFTIYAVVALRSGNSVLLRLAIFSVIVAAAIVKSLWVKINPPEGLVLSRKEAPRLFDEVEKIATKVGAPIPKEIRLDEQLNAAAAQRPRLGIFGLYENTLLLGMPLLLGLTPDEARSVIAHEFGHFSGQHGRFGAWAYRVNATWIQLRDNLYATGGRGAWLFISFVRWFSPRFAALTFVLRRRHEYDADASAADVAGAQSAAHALMRLEFLSKKLDESFWDPYYKQVAETPLPPDHAFAAMPSALAGSYKPEEINKLLTLSFKEKTGYSDTHPCLTDRLNALGQLPKGDIEGLSEELSAPVQTSAAEVFFGPTLGGILERLETRHKSRIRERWATENQRLNSLKQQLANLESVVYPTEEQEINRAVLTYRIKGEQEGEPLLRAAVEKYPNNGSPKFYVAEMLLERGDESGVPLMQEAIKQDRSWEREGRQLLANYYYLHGQAEKIEALKEEAIVSQANAAIAQRANRSLNFSDHIHPANLTAEQLSELRIILSAIKSLGVAYVVKRTIPGIDQDKYSVIVFPKWKLIEGKYDKRNLVHEIAQRPMLGGGTMIFSPLEKRKWIKKLDTIPGAKVYDSKG